MRAGVILSVLALMVAGCQTVQKTSIEADDYEVAAINEADVPEKNKGIVFIHGCGSRSLSLVFDVAFLDREMEKHPEATEYTDLLPSLCWNSK